MFKNPVVQASLALIGGLILLGPLGAVLGVVIWAVIWTRKN